jgi:uroporphyrinogen-III synthase
MRLIVTRPEEDGRPLAERLEAMGHEVILAPLLSIRPRHPLAVPERPYQAVLITSANGARAVAEAEGMARLKKARAFAIGPASSMAAYDAGFLSVFEAEGDVAALARSVRELLIPEAGPLLYVSGAVTAGDLEGSLEAAGFDVDRVIAYDAMPAGTLPHDSSAALREARADGVLLFSPRTAAIWAELVSAAGLEQAAHRLVHYCLSRNVAKTLVQSWGRKLDLRVASWPEEDALLDLIGAAA